MGPNMPDGFPSLLLRMHRLRVLMEFSSLLETKSSCLKSSKDSWSGENIFLAMKKSFEDRIKPDRVVKFRVLAKVGLPCSIKRAEGLSTRD